MRGTRFGRPAEVRTMKPIIRRAVPLLFAIGAMVSTRALAQQTPSKPDERPTEQTPAQSTADEKPAEQPPSLQPKPEERPTGLPSGIEWDFNLDASWGSFGFANSLYQNPKEDVPENLSDQWFEGSIKPALSARRAIANTSVFYGKVSGVGERTYGSAPELTGPDISSFQVDDMYLGWRSGNGFKRFGENAFDVTIGRARYQLGQGLLLYDGAAEGGSRGGYWTNARKAFQFAAIGRFHPGAHTVETFYLDKDDLPENETGTRLWGANYEYSAGERGTVGITYMKFFAHADILPDRDGLNVTNLRAYLAPVAQVPDATVALEYAAERNGDKLDSNAWTLQGAYEFSKVTWKPKLSYRYATFQGDDSATAKNEGFDPLLPGFHDWGSWWQGEIAGEYFVSNSNLTSHLLRAHITPVDAVSGGLMLFKFKLDQPASFAPGVTDNNLAFEMDAYADWKINKNFTASFIAALGNPQKAAQEAFDRTKNFAYGMVFLAYSY
jgi:hypothetical protein